MFDNTINGKFTQAKFASWFSKCHQKAINTFLNMFYPTRRLNIDSNAM